MAIETPLRPPGIPESPAPPSGPPGWAPTAPSGGSPPLKPHRRVAKKWWVVAGVGLVAIIAIAAGAASAKPAPSVGTLPAAAPTAPDSTTAAPTVDATAAPTANSLEGPVGTPYQITDDSNNEMSVTLTGLTNPAHASNQFEQAANGDRLVAAKFTITGMSGEFSDDANSDALLIGSDGQTYNFSVSDVNGCTNFNYGSYSVAAGQTSRGCVVFEIPNNVNVAQIEWNTSTPAIWDVS